MLKDKCEGEVEMYRENIVGEIILKLYLILQSVSREATPTL